MARSFLNVCRHRGANLACEGFGHGRRITCPYHSWTYDSQGALVGVTGRELFGPVDITGLIELPTVERHGIVFTVATPGLPLDLDEWLGDMGSALEHLQLDRLHRYEVTTTLVSGNWKATADGYLDGYHIGYLHREQHRYEVDQQSEYLRPVRAARPDRVRQQADRRDAANGRSTSGT